jgi:hypothetical protein
VYFPELIKNEEIKTIYTNMEKSPANPNSIIINTSILLHYNPKIYKGIKNDSMSLPN